MTEIYLVAGATGELGQQIVSRLLLKNRHVRAFVRDVPKGRALLGENLEVVEGDTRRIDTIHEAMEGVHTVICATRTRDPEGLNSPEQVDYEGVRNLANVAAHMGIERFILLSVADATNSLLEWKRKGEAALRESGVGYIIIRPARLTDAFGGQSAVKLTQGEPVSGEISRSDVAEIIVQVLAREAMHNVTFDVAAADGNAPQTKEDWDQLFAGLRQDQEAM